MNYLTIENASKSFGDKILFEDISLYINKGDKVALVAKNGAGKSTLLKIIEGEENVEGDHAIVQLHKDVRLGFLKQDPVMPAEQEVIDYLLSSEKTEVKIVRQYQKALLFNEPEKLQTALAAMEEHKAWDTEARLKEISYRLGITDFNRKLGDLSGGQRKRLALARLIFENPEFLVLDEPTNHLDLPMIEWLEDYLTAVNRTVFMVTHDRYFLDRVCNHMLELDGLTVHKYQGNYSEYLQKRLSRIENEDIVHEKNKKLLKKELEWVRRMPKARGTKNKARVDKFHEIKEEVYGKEAEANLEIQLDSARLGSKIVELHNVSKSFPETDILLNFDYKFKRKDRLGIIGNNGTGKSSLINIITGSLEPDSGKVVVGDTIQFGYYRQDGLILNEDKRVIDVIREIADYIPLKKGQKLTAESLLEKFMFPRSHQRVFVSQLSGGEKRRLYLLTVLMENPNFLILDEPTNDLDILTLNILEEYLLNFPGCLLVVSHDRYFMDKLVDHLFVLDGTGKVKDFPGTYSEFRKEVGMKALRASGNEIKTEKTTIDKPKRQSLSYNEKRELNEIDENLPKLNNRKKAIMTKFNEGELSIEDSSKLSNELGEIQEKIEDYELRWFELMEKKESLDA